MLKTGPDPGRCPVGCVGGSDDLRADSMDMYLPVLPRLTHDLGTSTSAAQLTMTECLAGLAVGQIIAGPPPAAQLGVSRTTVYKWRRRCAGPSSARSVCPSEDRVLIAGWPGKEARDRFRERSIAGRLPGVADGAGLTRAETRCTTWWPPRGAGFGRSERGSAGLTKTLERCAVLDMLTSGG